MTRNDELMHYGVLGMKWGQRRARKNYEKAAKYRNNAGVNKRYMNSDGSLNKKGVKKYARESYAKNQLKNEGRLGRAYDRYTGAHKMAADMQYSMNSNAKNKAAANAYVKSMNKSKANKYEAKAKSIENYHTKMAGGKKAYNYTKNQSTGKAVAKSMLLGTYGAAKYNEARANGAGRPAATARAMLLETANNATGGAMSVVEPRVNKREVNYPPRKKRNK